MSTHLGRQLQTEDRTQVSQIMAHQESTSSINMMEAGFKGLTMPNKRYD